MWLDNLRQFPLDLAFSRACSRELWCRVGRAGGYDVYHRCVWKVVCSQSQRDGGLWGEHAAFLMTCGAENVYKARALLGEFAAGVCGAGFDFSGLGYHCGKGEILGGGISSRKRFMVRCAFSDVPLNTDLDRGVVDFFGVLFP